jgi:hypothetical protein
MSHYTISFHSQHFYIGAAFSQEGLGIPVLSLKPTWDFHVPSLWLCRLRMCPLSVLQRLAGPRCVIRTIWGQEHCSAEPPNVEGISSIPYHQPLLQIPFYAGLPSLV